MKTSSIFCSGLTWVEQVTKDGQTKSVHVIVKNQPFHLVIGLVNAKVFNQVRWPSGALLFNLTSFFPQEIDLNNLLFDVSLVYDKAEDEQEKEVDFVKNKPIEYKPKSQSQVGPKYLSRLVG